ncbi:hypothetical protein [Radiobacillus deserti]|uniref:DUF2892 domain-containing protein n=1 Tax=Radiobacillus deserti TaxID=2594883 RepID=A0A516KJE6_9BACI|nr:hypothetical protein [Radiobacillus deserti]QDP41518.1 hypothetical protein FN924_15865 [Radiobacillus deserti]
MLNQSEEGYRKFKVVYHSIILLFGLTLIITYIFGARQMDRGLLFLVLGIVFTLESVFGLCKNLNKVQSL